MRFRSEPDQTPQATTNWLGSGGRDALASGLFTLKHLPSEQTWLWFYPRKKFATSFFPSSVSTLSG